MTTRARNLLFLVAVVGVAVLGFVLARPKDTVLAGGGVMDAVPKDAFLVAIVHVDALRASPLVKPLAQGAPARLLGVPSAVQQACGFDPIARVHDVALAVPEGGERGEFGVAAATDLTTEEIVGCAKKAIEARGGTARVGQRDGFTTVEDASEAATAQDPGKQTPKLATIPGTIVVARGPWLDAMIKALAGRAPRVKDNAAHAELFAALATRAAGRKTQPAIIATAVLPASLRTRLKSEMGAEIAADGGPPQNPAMSGVLGVATAGVAITAGASGEDSIADVEMRCDDDAACAEVETLVQRQRLAWSQNLMLRLFGLGPLVESLSVEARGRVIHAGARAPTDPLASGIERAMSALAAQKSATPAPPSSAAPPR